MEKLAAYLAAHKQEGLTQAGFATIVGVTQAMVWQWLNGKKPVSPEAAAQIEIATKCAVCRWDLRPDDWHRIWPELIGREGAPAVPAAPTVEAA